MSTQSEEILRSALALSDAERAKIAASLIRSLDAKGDEQADAAWAAEIERRIKSIDHGEVELIPWDDVLQEIRDRE